MRILHLVHQYPPDFIGGTELYTQALANAQATRGHVVTVFSPSITTTTSIENGVTIQRVPLGARTAQATFFSTFHQPVLSEAWRATLAQVQPDLVHVQHLMGVLATAINELHRRQIPYVVTLHDYYYACANAMLLTNYHQSIWRRPAGVDQLRHCALARAGHDRLALAIARTGSASRPVGTRVCGASSISFSTVGLAPTEFRREVYQHQFPFNI